MSFDDLLRQGQDLQARAAAERGEADAKRKAELQELREFRESLRAFGRWFATEARQQHLPAVPFYAEAPKWEPPPEPPKRSWFGGSRRRTDTPRPQPVLRGWAVTPLRPGSGELQTTQTWRLGTRSFGDEVFDGFTVSWCLAVDTDGGLRVGADAKTAVYIHRDKHHHTGLTPEELNPGFLSVISGLDGGMPPYLNYRNQADAAMIGGYAELSRELEAKVVPLFIAGAKLLLDRAKT